VKQESSAEEIEQLRQALAQAQERAFQAEARILTAEARASQAEAQIQTAEAKAIEATAKNTRSRFSSAASLDPDPRRSARTNWKR